MIFVQDTREKPGKHNQVEKYLAEHGVKVIRNKLYVGDMTRLEDQSTVIDYKRNIDELAMDLCQDHKRFREELQRAQDADIRLIILVQNRAGVRNPADLMNWVNPRSKQSPMAPNGERLFKIMRAMAATYGAEFRFCDPMEVGRITMEILGHGQAR